MPSLKILCTRKTSRPEPHLAISHVGGANASNMPWMLAVADVIRTIELKQYTFLVMLEGRRCEVVVAQTQAGEKYLRCQANDVEGQALLRMPDCP